MITEVLKKGQVREFDGDYSRLIHIEDGNYAFHLNSRGELLNSVDYVETLPNGQILIVGEWMEN